MSGTVEQTPTQASDHEDSLLPDCIFEGADETELGAANEPEEDDDADVTEFPQDLILMIGFDPAVDDVWK